MEQWWNQKRQAVSVVSVVSVAVSVVSVAVSVAEREAEREAERVCVCGTERESACDYR